MHMSNLLPVENIHDRSNNPNMKSNIPDETGHFINIQEVNQGASSRKKRRKKGKYLKQRNNSKNMQEKM